LAICLFLVLFKEVRVLVVEQQGDSCLEKIQKEVWFELKTFGKEKLVGAP